MKTILHKVVSIIPKINGSLLCKYTNDAFIMSVEDNKTLKNVTEKLHKAHHTPREAIQQLLTLKSILSILKFMARSSAVFEDTILKSQHISLQCQHLSENRLYCNS